MKKEEYIKQLLDKYLDGETSSAEERALRGYFTNRDNNIPEEWMPYKALFAYIAEERADAAETAPNSRQQPQQSKEDRPPRMDIHGHYGSGSHTYSGGDDRAAAP